MKSFSIILFFACLLAGCGKFFNQKSTEFETNKILGELDKIRVIPETQPSIPDIYKEPPKIVAGRDGVRLYYFIKFHVAADVVGIITQQFKEYSISSVSATNQIIVKCETEEEAKEVLVFLENLDIQPIQVRVDCLISEVYADLAMDWETINLIENLFGENFTIEGSLPGASLREVSRSEFGLRLGYWKNRGVSSEQFKVLLDVLVSRGYMKILMNPSLEVVNGKAAKILTTEMVPIPKEVVGGGANVLPYTITEYTPVIDSLEVTPYVFADGYIGLETKATISSKATPEGVKQIPILTRREIENKENRIRQGESLVIGGIKKIEKRSVIRGIPFLKDLPLVGVFFSSKDFEERAKEVLFIITPTISQGGQNPAELREMLEKQHLPPAEAEAGF